MIEMQDIVKQYKLGGETIYALDHVSLRVEKGEYVTIIGPSGSGKSTLMNLIGCLDTADSGSYLLNGKPIRKYRERQLAEVRFLGNHDTVSWVWQSKRAVDCYGVGGAKALFALISLIDGVPMIYQGVRASERKKRAVAALERVGLGERMKHRPNQLSGGQQQRCAIARAIAVHPSLILADEPTGNLDQKTGREILTIFDELHQAGNIIVLITHDPKVARCGQRMIRIEDGRLYEPKEADADDLSVV